MRVAVFVDGANYFYMQKTLGWRVDAQKILDYCSRFGEIVDANYYTSIDSPREKLHVPYLSSLNYMGYAVIIKYLKSFSDESHIIIQRKANLDVEIVLDMLNTIENYDLAVLVSGDSDFERSLQILKERNKQFKVLSTDGNVAVELLDIAGTDYIDFQSIREQVEMKKPFSRLTPRRML